MPDGDIVHKKLSRIYQKPYAWLCEGSASNDECASAALDALKRDISYKGDLPLTLASTAAEALNQAIQSVGVKEPVDWANLNQRIESLVQQADGAPRVKDLLLRAVQSVVQECRYGSEFKALGTKEVIVRQYISEVYEAEFKQRIPLTPQHHAGIDRATLSERINQIQSTVSLGIAKLAASAVAQGSVKRLQLRGVVSKKAIDLWENLLCPTK
ncbi:hypothetical protein [Phormidium tenue]|uniref:Uncharacterized protein n=1 Tax=Phormidium tenue NIES-30 TaxID=549789 RepID=A0A1U7J5W7_9CYAN|nr:hypothetical protein [Phormidium tenue]MBD2232101.1 hypothetical protein [Phormidium tenue FACHB-1052]OKH48312.1 hypothetical protein NIES30_09755 [Phormidium tenue NIES-30]